MNNLIKIIPFVILYTTSISFYTKTFKDNPYLIFSAEKINIRKQRFNGSQWRTSKMNVKKRVNNGALKVLVIHLPRKA